VRNIFLRGWIFDFEEKIFKISGEKNFLFFRKFRTKSLLRIVSVLRVLLPLMQSGREQLEQNPKEKMIKKIR